MAPSGTRLEKDGEGEKNKGSGWVGTFSKGGFPPFPAD